MLDFLAGAIALGYAIAALFFWRFWRRMRDGLFAGFAVAFALMALTQTLAALLELGREEQGWLYLIRLTAFMVIMAAIVAKNIEAKPKVAGRPTGS